MLDESIYGCDYSSTGEVTSKGDIMLVDGLDNAVQAISNQLLTRKGTYPSVDTDYGSEAYSIIGEDFTKTSMDALKVHLENALYKQPRVKSIISIDPYGTIDKKLRVNVNVQLVDGTNKKIKLNFME